MNISKSNTYLEMLECLSIAKKFDFSQTKKLADRISKGRIIFTGLGSSLIFPGKQAKRRAMDFNLENTIEVFFASDLLHYPHFKDCTVFLASNSGKTKETMLLLEEAKRQGAYTVAITAVADSPIAKNSDEVIQLIGGFEKGVAATKSVFEQGLVYDSLIFHLAAKQSHHIDFSEMKEEVIAAAEAMQQNTQMKIPSDIVHLAAESKHLIFVGPECGVGEELSLKADEIVRKMGIFLANTQILHGPAEVMSNECVFLLQDTSYDPFINDFKKFASVTQSAIVSVSNTADFERAIPYKSSTFFNHYCQLSAGWGILMNLGEELQVDVDNPQKIQKVGNPIS